jgi:hypothetical protein
LKDGTMSQEVYKYAFAPQVPVEEAEASLYIAVVAAECLHGEAQVRLDARHFFDGDRRACAIDAGTAVGRDIAKLYTGLLKREFGELSFSVERLASPPLRPAA